MKYLVNKEGWEPFWELWGSTKIEPRAEVEKEKEKGREEELNGCEPAGAAAGQALET